MDENQINLDKELPYISEELPGIGGEIKQNPEDFKVKEIPLYDPSGKGEHVYINITKKLANTKYIQKKIGKTLNVHEKEIGFAGIKDKNSVSTQTISVKIQENIDEENFKEKIEKEIPEIKINWIKRHKNKLRKGHLLGNEFEIKISIEKDEETLDKANNIINKLNKTGIPNFYGEQRLGKDMKNAEEGYKIIKKETSKKDKWLKNFLISSYQSYLFNQYLKIRIRENLFNKILKGDIAKKLSSGGIFEVEEKSKEQERFDNREISFTGPIFGKKMKQPSDEALELEEQILKENNITLEEISKFSEGTRRQGIIFPEIKAEIFDSGLKLNFTLPKGAFATIVLREIMKNTKSL